jgi:acyl-CoA reductase-like NAD-dependent aldehyde dehydrogenase
MHIHTLVRSDGRDRMPHWKEQGIWECVEGTPGCRPPKRLEPLLGEPVFRKRFYSALGVDDLLAALEDLAVDHLIVAGLYLHGCVRSTVLDAYARGFTIWVAEDATASTDPLHAQVTRQLLAGRIATFLQSKDVLKKLENSESPAPSSTARIQPVGYIGDKWITAGRHALWEKRNPTNWEEVLARVPMATEGDVAAAATASLRAQPAWVSTPAESRAQLLVSWADRLASRESDLAQLIALELGKPIRLATDEVRFAVRLIRATAGAITSDQPWQACNSEQAYARRCSVGIVGIITPWNNPVAISAGKIAPAIGLGNGVIWKAAPHAPRTAVVLMDTMSEAGLPQGLVNVVFGGPQTVRGLISRTEIAVISFTGSCDAGRQVASLCGRHGKLLQAELGGNNAAVIMPDADLETSARELAASAFSFAGQRCTATRRFIIHYDIARQFREALVVATESLPVGDPMDPQTHVGPVISREKQERLKKEVQAACFCGARLLCGGRIPSAWTMGCWFEPTLLDAPNPSLPIVQEETFGPVALLQVARNIEDALDRLNGVAQGLIASLYSQDRDAQRLFLKKAECGILKLNQPTVGVIPGAPFGGWKASGLGPPEHGVGDRECYTRWQSVYGWPRKR